MKFQGKFGIHNFEHIWNLNTIEFNSWSIIQKFSFWEHYFCCYFSYLRLMLDPISLIYKLTIQNVFTRKQWKIMLRSYINYVDRKGEWIVLNTKVHNAIYVSLKSRWNHWKPLIFWNFSQKLPFWKKKFFACARIFFQKCPRSILRNTSVKVEGGGSKAYLDPPWRGMFLTQI